MISLSGFRLIPGKGFIAMAVVVIALALGLAYSLSKAVRNADRVVALETTLKRTQADLEALRGTLQVYRGKVRDSAEEAAQAQRRIKEATKHVEKASRTADSTGPERLQRTLEAARQSLKD